MNRKLTDRQKETIQAVVTLAELGLIPKPPKGAGKTGQCPGKLSHPLSGIKETRKTKEKARARWFECGYWFVGVGQAWRLSERYGPQYVDNVNSFVIELNRLNNDL